MAKNHENKHRSEKKCPHCNKSNAHPHTRAAYDECESSTAASFKINKKR